MPQTPPAPDAPSPTPAYRWRHGALQPVLHARVPALDGLLNIDTQKARLLANTAQFVAGLPANHALLTGARGTGKSTLVRALAGPFGPQGLRLVEVSPHDLLDLPEIVAPLRERADERFVLYVDDFSVSGQDSALTALKTALDGGLEDTPDNVLVYATSNRRYLMPQPKTDNGEYRWVDDELHPGESSEERISLSERFGLWLSFHAFNQDAYLAMVRRHLAEAGLPPVLVAAEAWREEGLRWALTRASRSGRVARQFARDWAGRWGLAQAQANEA